MLENLGFAQKQRLAYIEFCLLFRGSIYRKDLIYRFEIGLSAGSKDFSIYKELAPNNLRYDAREKRYFQTADFIPLFEHDAKRTLMKLANDISDGFDAVGDIHFPIDLPRVSGYYFAVQIFRDFYRHRGFTHRSGTQYHRN